MLGMVSGALTALLVVGHRSGQSQAEIFASLLKAPVIVHIAMGALLAAALNIASNVLNQWTDLENDRINKPHRPLPRGLIGPVELWLLVFFFYAAALALAGSIRPDGRWDTLLVVLAGLLLTLAYSVPPVRTKRFGTWANLTIALARGCLLKVAGWSLIAGVFSDAEPWYLGFVMALFLFGATATKDFADVEGDEAAGCKTWPLAFGPAKAARLMAPFLTLPWLLLPLGALGADPILSASLPALTVLALILALYGSFTARLILRDHELLAHDKNHPSWTHMYGLMLVAQVGLVIVYLLPA